MDRKRVVTIMLLVIFILCSFLPILVVNAATSETITLNSSLYNAIKTELQSQGISVTYNDVQNTLTISNDEIVNVTKLNLSNREISDLTGLDIFTNLTTLDLSANKLTKDSNLDVLSSLNLNSLDLSSNRISDISAISNINEIKTLNLHNQVFDEVTIINNAILKDGVTKYEAKLPQIITNFAKPIKSEWLKDEYINHDSSDIKIDWSAFNANSDFIKVVIGTEDGDIYNGLVTLKVKIEDTTNTLYNSEINLYYIIIDEAQRVVSIKDENLYKSIKSQLVKGQSVNSELTQYTATKNLYDYVYNDQKMFVINENVLVNEINSLVLDNKKITDLSGIEMFIGLEKSLNVSSNYIDTIDRIINLQETKSAEETELQARFREKIEQYKERNTNLETLQKDLENVIKTYNEAVGKYNSYVNSNDQNKTEKLLEQLAILKTQGKRYIELTGNYVTLFGVQYTTTTELDSLNTVSGMTVSEISKESTITGGQITEAEQKVDKKSKEIYDTYNKVYKLASVITPNLKNITDEEFKNLTLEEAKALLQNQVTKLNSIEKYFTKAEKAWLQDNYGIFYTEENKTALEMYLKDTLKNLEENPNVNSYKLELSKLRSFDAYVSYYSSSLIKTTMGNEAHYDGEHYQIYLKNLDGEDTTYITEQRDKYISTAITDDSAILNFLSRIANASEEDIIAYITLPKLYNLNMNENLIEDIHKISIMKELRGLAFGENEIVNINNVNWSEIPMLHVLNLSFNNISNVKALEVLKNIQILDVSKNLIGGSFDLTITDMKKLTQLNLSSNQIDDIQYLKTQYEFIAKANGMDVNQFLTSDIAPEINLKKQMLVMELTLNKSTSTTKIKLPEIFSQLEELQWQQTSFGINSVYGNVTSDGKYVLLNTNIIGSRMAEVVVTGNGIGTETSCKINYTVTDPSLKPSEPSNEVIVTINTNNGSSVKSVKKVSDTNYIIVSENTTVSQVLQEVTLNTEKYEVAIKDADCQNKRDDNEKVKTNESLVVDGLDDKTKCTIVVKGDITGDGSINMSDILKLNQYRNNKAQLTEAEVLAGNVVDSDNQIDMRDILKLNQYRLNKIEEL